MHNRVVVCLPKTFASAEPHPHLQPSLELEALARHSSTTANLPSYTFAHLYLRSTWQTPRWTLMRLSRPLRRKTARIKTPEPLRTLSQYARSKVGSSWSRTYTKRRRKKMSQICSASTARSRTSISTSTADLDMPRYAACRLCFLDAALTRPVQGYALIEYPTQSEAKAAIDGAQNEKLMEQTVNVDFAFVRPPQNKASGTKGGRKSDRRRSVSPTDDRNKGRNDDD